MTMRIVVASDGTPGAWGALRLTGAVAERCGAAVEVVAVLEPIPVRGFGTADVVQTARRGLERAGQHALRARVQADLSELGTALSAWPISVPIGSPAATLVAVAAEKKASLIVLGRGSHVWGDRLFGTETALRVARLAHVPVFAVPADAAELSRSAVVAIDFSETSRGAARAVLDLVAPGARVHLVHVLSKPTPDLLWIAGTEGVDRQRASVPAKLEELARVIERAADVEVDVHVPEGDPTLEILRLAEAVGADLIAAGSHGTGRLGRILMGSVSSRLLRAATGAVLVVPPHTIPAELDRVPVRYEENEPAVLP